MAGFSKNLQEPDEVIEFPSVSVQIVDLGDATVAYTTYEPGWRWSTHVRPEVGGEWCQARHMGVVLSGRLGVQFPDGSTMEVGPDDVFDIPPGHDGYVIGHERIHTVEWTGVRAFAGFRAGARGRVLATLLLTDIVDSTARANELGDAAWRERLSTLFGRMRDQIDRFNGREVNTTGDGMIVSFEGPANAVRCATQLVRIAAELDLPMRAGVHVGEVEIVGTDVRGVAVHEAERVMASAGPGEILVSEPTRSIAITGGLNFEDRGLHTLKGLPGERRLFAFVPAPSA